MWWGWVIAAAVILVYAAYSKKLSVSVITGPMVFVALGLLLSQHGLGLVEIELDGHLTKGLFKATLALLLFIEASRLDANTLRRDVSWIVRLLFVVMPLVIALGAGAAALGFEISVWEALILGVILAPTDASLGGPVVNNKAVPAKVRRTLVVESGLNDGLALPLALIFTGAALWELGIEVQGDPWVFVLEQIGFGVLGGVVLGAAAGWLVATAATAERIGGKWLHIAPLAAALLAYAGAEALGGNGFVAVWLGGLMYGFVSRRYVPDDHEFAEFSEDLSEVLIGISFFVFGATILGPAIEPATWQIVVYGLVSLILVRPIATFLGFVGARMDWRTGAFIGWFGPRGVASIIIVAIVVKEAGLPKDDFLITVTAVAVALSVFLHGLTAAPGGNWYARSVDDLELESHETPN